MKKDNVINQNKNIEMMKIAWNNVKINPFTKDLEEIDNKMQIESREM